MPRDVKDRQTSSDREGRAAGTTPHSWRPLSQEGGCGECSGFRSCTEVTRSQMGAKGSPVAGAVKHSAWPQDASPAQGHQLHSPGSLAPESNQCWPSCSSHTPGVPLSPPGQGTSAESVTLLDTEASGFPLTKQPSSLDQRIILEFSEQTSSFSSVWVNEGTDGRACEQRPRETPREQSPGLDPQGNSLRSMRTFTSCS